MEVLILSKTHFGKNVCVGGMVLNTKMYVRLLNPGGWYPNIDTKFNVGDVWDIQYNAVAEIKEPHNEDVIVRSQYYRRKIDNISSFIIASQVPIWKGHIENIFDGKLIWAKTGSGYLSANTSDYPTHSVGFWMSDKPLSFENDHYIYPADNVFPNTKSFNLTAFLNSKGARTLKYKGLPNPINIIPANTLIRVSLAKWWKPAGSDVEARCYLQLSGWYDYTEPDTSSNISFDLPS